MVPKDHRPGEFRLIIDLSASMGGSVNEGIGPNLTSLTYPRVEDAVRFVKAAGPGASMAKLDLKAAYRHVPVHPDDQSLLAIRWGGTTYLDTVSRSAYAPPPSCSLLWPMALLGVWCVKGSPISFITWMTFFCPTSQSQDCGQSLAVAVKLYEDLGFPVAPDKVVGHSTTLTFLGIELDSITMVMRLPKSKLECLKASLCRWLCTNLAQKRQLQSQLSNAAIVVWPGRTFLQSLIEMVASRSPQWRM